MSDMSGSTASTRKQTPIKYTRCKKGSRRNKKTHECEDNKHQLFLQRVKAARGRKKERCKRGTRKNRKTGVCQPYVRLSWDNIRQASLTSAEKRDANELFQRQVQAAKNVMSMYANRELRKY